MKGSSHTAPATPGLDRSTTMAGGKRTSRTARTTGRRRALSSGEKMCWARLLVHAVRRPCTRRGSAAMMALLPLSFVRDLMDAQRTREGCARLRWLSTHARNSVVRAEAEYYAGRCG